MGTRYDVSAVPPQGGYIAKQCPVRAQNNTLLPGEPVPASPEAKRRMALGRIFEVEVFDFLLTANPAAVWINDSAAADREESTAASMAAGVDLILGGRLPTDHVGRRVGQPDVLIRSADPSTVAYRAVDVKHHMTLTLSDGGGAKCSHLIAPAWESSTIDAQFTRRTPLHRGDLLQLAHYQRMLEAAGFAAPERVAGIIGTEGQIVWHDLDEPVFKTPSSTGRQKMRSTMEVYDFEFDFRLDIIARTALHMTDGAVDLLVPVKIGECGECPWWGYCGPQLEAGAGDVSLIPKVGWLPWKSHRERGVRTRADLARLDPKTARLIDEKVDVAHVLSLARDADPATPVAELIAKRPAQIARLEATGVRSAADALELCGTTAAYSNAKVSGLAEQIDLARAVLGGEPAYRRRGVERIEVPRADLEVDIDLESFGQGVYLWGALVTDRSGVGVEQGYRAFLSWDFMGEAEELQTFECFWEWLMALRAEATSQGRTFRAYCYSEGAEKPNLLRIARPTPHAEEVAAFLASDDWVDMLKVFRTQVITGYGNGLKDIAPLAGFEWSVDDAGGGASMLHYETATRSPDPKQRELARQWLLDYNRGDVQATAAVRDWLDSKGPSILGIETAPVP